MGSTPRRVPISKYRRAISWDSRHIARTFRRPVPVRHVHVNERTAVCKRVRGGGAKREEKGVSFITRWPPCPPMKKKTRTACATIQRWMYEEPAAWQDPMGCTADSQLPEWQLQVPSVRAVCILGLCGPSGLAANHRCNWSLFQGAGRPPTLVSTRPEGPASLAGISLCYGDSVSFQGRRGCNYRKGSIVLIRHGDLVTSVVFTA